MHRAKSMIDRLRPTPPAIDSSSDNAVPRRSRLVSLESLMSFGLGSDVNGGTISGPICANQGYKACTLPGIRVCPAVRALILLFHTE